METRTIEVDVPAFEDECPAIPDGASLYERQQANMLWRNAIRSADDAVGRLMVLRNRVLNGDATDLTPFANDVQHAAVAVASASALRAHLDGIHHRLALQDRVVDVLEGDEFWETATAIQEIWGPKIVAAVRGET